MAIVVAENISFAYRHEDVFSAISFDVHEGEVFCLFGPNGCGKSTLLECLLALLAPREGRVIVGGNDIHKLNPVIAGRHISYVPQSHTRTFPYHVSEVILMGRAPYLGIHESPGQKDYDIVDQCLTMLGIERLRDQDYTTLSGGELQLVMVARALAQQTTVIVMDEPTAHLDFQHELVILEAINGLVEQNKTIVMTTHVPNQAYYLEYNGVPIRVALMNKRKLVALGRPSQVLTEDNMERTYGIRSKVVSLPACCNENRPLKQIVALGMTARTGAKEYLASHS